MRGSAQRLTRYPPPVVTSSGLRVGFVSDPRSLEAVYRLRHAVFTEELGRTLFARGGRYRDDLDAGVTHVIAALDADTVVGTLRVTLRVEQPFLDEDESLLAAYCRLAGVDDVSEIALADRGAIAGSHRSRGLYDVMWERLFAFCRLRSARRIMGVIDSSNESLVAFHRNRGWATWRSGVPLCDLTGDAIVKVLGGTSTPPRDE